ncbi:MFS transporter [Limosilactobacillus sp. RRLNB_1_1]|uniref:MFS transporter n=1 Tax=Limosilactobacillus albertensis TaxID=2759752 RepID=A0A7W3TSF9_9LACO|nr:MFS transporter [Limosilactobacillus albertensis]MBB1070043.1 MFS transporter [Limosilactobacillus albertensis]MCD7117280.1 MFS transporter [Limosilactobacillus albertensis]MCD7128884.1 MFS transporter [Limosilactobacillus albertensis]
MEMPIAESQINKRRLSLSLYMNYLIHGFGIIILAQNMVALGSTWQVPIKTVSFVISGIGIGRLVAYLITGTLADMLSRKLFVFIGMACYLIFALGMVITHSIPVAYGLAILAGIANSALDAGTYTTLVEMNNGKGYDTILIKGFVSIGEFILPLIVAALSANNLWFGWSFIVMAVLTIANMINMSTVKFPKIQRVTLRHHQQTVSQSKKSLRKIFATILLLGYGYTSMAVMIWFTQWITLFAQKSLGYGNLTAHTLLSLYSVGSIIGVITLFILLKRNINEMTLLISLNLVAVIALLIILIEGNNINLVSIASLVFGFSAAGGIMQTGLTVFMNLYPHHRGMVTGAFYFFGSIASFTVPLITGILSTHSIQLAFAGDLAVALSGTVLMVVLALLNVKEKINNGTN